MQEMFKKDARNRKTKNAPDRHSLPETTPQQTCKDSVIKDRIDGTI
jgi:hypothetical protein